MYLLRQLTRTLVPIYHERFQSEGLGEQVSDKGALQLLFDVRFLLTILESSWGGSQFANQDWEGEEYWRNQTTQLLSAIRSKVIELIYLIIMENHSFFYSLCSSLKMYKIFQI